jgi:acyl dehydratase
VRYLEEFEPAQKFASGRLSVEAARIKSFATEFDPQPFHLDEDRGRGSFFKGLAASGSHAAAMTMRLLVASELKPADGIIGVGFDEMRWPRPVRRGDELHVETEVLEIRASKISAGSGRDQGKDDDVESERRAGAGLCWQPDRAAPTAFLRRIARPA